MAHSLAITPSLQYEANLPVRVPGRLSAGGELGLGPAFVWIRQPDQPYVPAHWDTVASGLGRISGWFRFGLDVGVVFTVQPLGLLFSIVRQPLPTGGTARTQVFLAYEFGISAGWRFK